MEYSLGVGNLQIKAGCTPPFGLPIGCRSYEAIWKLFRVTDAIYRVPTLVYPKVKMGYYLQCHFRRDGIYAVRNMSNFQMSSMLQARNTKVSNHS